MRTRILFISPYRDDADRLSRMLEPLELQFEHVHSVAQARMRLTTHDYAVVLTEADLPDGTWVHILDLAQAAVPRMEVLVTDPLADSRFWAEALNLGAYDIIAQPFRESEVQRILSNACSRSSRRRMSRAAL